MAKAVLINPNNGAIDTRYDPHDIDDPFSYRARDGFMGVEMWPGQDNRVYMQGHVVIPNPWGNVTTNGTTTTTTDDTTDKDGGDDAETCGTGENCTKDSCDDQLFGDTPKTPNRKKDFQWDFAVNKYNCEFIECCAGIYKTLAKEKTTELALEFIKSKGNWTEKVDKLAKEAALLGGRWDSCDDWSKKHKDDCKKAK